jgi:hypothetical protein
MNSALLNDFITDCSRNKKKQKKGRINRMGGDQMVVHVICRSSSEDADSGVWIEIPHFNPHANETNSE